MPLRVWLTGDGAGVNAENKDLKMLFYFFFKHDTHEKEKVHFSFFVLPIVSFVFWSVNHLTACRSSAKAKEKKERDGGILLVGAWLTPFFLLGVLDLCGCAVMQAAQASRSWLPSHSPNVIPFILPPPPPCFFYCFMRDKRGRRKSIDTISPIAIFLSLSFSSMDKNYNSIQYSAETKLGWYDTLFKKKTSHAATLYLYQIYFR